MFEILGIFFVESVEESKKKYLRNKVKKFFLR